MRLQTTGRVAPAEFRQTASGARCGNKPGKSPAQGGTSELWSRFMPIGTQGCRSATPWDGQRRSGFRNRFLNGGSPGEIQEGVRSHLLGKMPIPLMTMCGSISVAGVSASCVDGDATKRATDGLLKPVGSTRGERLPPVLFRRIGPLRAKMVRVRESVTPFRRGLPFWQSQSETRLERFPQRADEAVRWPSLVRPQAAPIGVPA